MLVLSRREDQKVLFPSLGISLSVLKVKGNVVKVGVDAPREIPVFRDEVAHQRGIFDISSIEGCMAGKGLSLNQNQRHKLNNILNTANIALHLTRKQIEAGLPDAAEESLQKVIDKLGEIEEQIAQQRRVFRKHAFIVEDDDNERELMASFLSFCGMQVTTACNGSEALKILRHRRIRPDFVLLDMNMPKCNGQEFLYQVDKRNLIPDAEIYGVSGCTPDEFGVREGSVSKWYCKPFNPQSLVSDLMAAHAS